MAKTPLSVNKFRLVFTAWWIAWAGFQAVIVYWLGFPGPVSMAESLVTNLFLAGCCLLVSNNLKYYLPQQERYWYILVLSLVLSGFWLVMSRWVLVYLTDSADYQLFLKRSLPIRFGIAFLLIACMAMISVVWYTFEEQKENELRRAEAANLSREAELYKLRQQLQPHFLFNSLNSISALIGSSPEQARTMIQQLSDFLRGTIKKEDQQWVNLSEELQYLELYLAIEKVRFGHRLSTVSAIEETSLTLKLPNMLLQPIVENAIKFGLYDTTGDILIRIGARSGEQQLIISVENPFDPETAQPIPGTGFGLSSVQRRLQLLFARNDLLTTTIKDHLFTTIVKIPQHQW